MKSARIALIISAVGVLLGLGVVAYFMFLGPGHIEFSGKSLDEVMENGVAARARVLKVWDTGVSINDNPQVGLLVEFPLPGKFPVQAEVKTVVSRLKAALVQPGVTAEVKYDPQNPKRLQLLSLELAETAPGGAEARLEELVRLHEKGLITDEEYRQKREEVLKSL